MISSYNLTAKEKEGSLSHFTQNFARQQLSLQSRSLAGARSTPQKFGEEERGKGKKGEKGRKRVVCESFKIYLFY